MKDGILVLNKPQNWTSSDCVSICRRALRCRGNNKVGHGGTLDPMATGLLPIFVGQATRIMEYLDLDSKTYRCKALLGRITDTLDIWGETVETRAFDGITERDIREGLQSFEGWIKQTPPKYSAVRINGKRLYEYARRGETIEAGIKQRNVNIEKIDLLSVDAAKGEFAFDVTCSKGTYIRTICSDLGDKLGCGCIMTFLERTAVGNIRLDGSVPALSPLRIKAGCADEAAESLASELEKRLLPADYPLVHFGCVDMSEDRTVYFSRGNSIRWHQIRVLDAPDRDYMIRRDPDGRMPENTRGRRYDRIYKVYQRETGDFLGTGYYDQRENILRADKVFVEKR